MAFSVGGIVNGDFCSGGLGSTPDETIIEIMDTKGIDPQSMKYRAVYYVVNECDFTEAPFQESPLQVFEDFEELLSATVNQIREFVDQIQTIGDAVVSRDTDVNITEIVEEPLELVVVEGRKLIAYLDKLLTDLVCRRIYDVYYKAIHEAVCENSFHGLVWVFSSLLVIGFSGCLMLMFRATLYPPRGGEDDDYSWNQDREEPVNVPSQAKPANSGYVEEDGVKEELKPADEPMVRLFLQEMLFDLPWSCRHVVYRKLTFKDSQTKFRLQWIGWSRTASLRYNWRRKPVCRHHCYVCP